MRRSLKEVEQMVLPGGPWPDLSPQDLLTFDRGGVLLRGPRGPGAVKEVPGGARRRAENLQRDLVQRFEWIAGVGLPHGK